MDEFVKSKEFMEIKHGGTLESHMLHTGIPGGSWVQILARESILYKFEWELTYTIEYLQYPVNTTYNRMTGLLVTV